MSKTKKIILSLCVIFLLIVPLTVHADVGSDEVVLVDGPNDIFCGNNKDYGFSVDGVMFSVQRGNTWYDGGRVDSIYLDNNVYRLRLDLNSIAGSSLMQGDVVYVSLFLTPLHSSFLDANNTVTGSFRFGMKGDATVMSSYDVRRWDGSKSQIAKRDVQIESWGDYVKCIFNENTFGNVYNRYTIDFQYKVSSYVENYSQYIYLQDFNFKVADKDKYYIDSIDDSIDKNTDKITANQDANTDKQIQADKDLYEQEKGEIQESGDQATESADDVPNQSDGFINALGKLVSAMSYNGTECKWTLPQVKMPKIANIVPEMTLIESQDIDFGFWVQKMPSNILNLIRAVCTGALIVYCFKELYGTISYVFTLKGGSE